MYDRILVPLKGDPTYDSVVAHTGPLAKMSGGRIGLPAPEPPFSGRGAFTEEQGSTYRGRWPAGDRRDGRRRTSGYGKGPR